MNRHPFFVASRLKNGGKFIVLLLLLLSVTLTASAFRGRNGRFIPHPDNPIIEPGFVGEWDGTIFEPAVLYENETFYMFHSAASVPFNSAANIGVASSTDGITWSREVDAPILAGDGTGFDAYLISGPTVIKEDNAWIMYYAGQPTPPPFPNGLQVGRATAISPNGPWTRLDEPVLTTGSAGEWDSGFVFPDAIIPMRRGYMMYYTGGSDFLSQQDFMVGLAFSSDGITWHKYNNRRTKAAPFAESDPVLKPGEFGSWDDANVWEVDVLKTNRGWEMYYTGTNTDNETAIGFARSRNGIHWRKSWMNPILTIADDSVDGLIVESPSVVRIHGKRLMFFDYGVGGEGIGVATKTFAFPSR